MNEQTFREEKKSIDEALISGVDVRSENPNIDDGGVVSKELMRLKQVRANAKRELTKAINRVSDSLTVGEETGQMQVIERRLDEAFHNFKEAWMKHKNLLDDDDDLEESTAYFHEAKTKYLCSKDRVALWLESRKKQLLERVKPPDIEPKESISQSKSYFSRHSSSSSRRSKAVIAEKQFNNATKMASLRAEASMLEQHQRIANEELRINQLKEKLALETQLAKLAAEERVCVEFKTLSGSCCEEEFGETQDGLMRDPIGASLNMKQTKELALKTSTALIFSDPCRQKASISPPEQLNIKPSLNGIATKEISENHATFSGFESRTPLCWAGYGDTMKESPDEHNVSQQLIDIQDPVENAVTMEYAPPRRSDNTYMTRNPLMGYFATPQQAFDINAPTWQPSGNPVFKESDALEVKNQRQQKEVAKVHSKNGSLSGTDEGINYLEAMKALATAALLPRAELMHFDERFGDAYKVSRTWLTKVMDGAQIRPGDGEALQDLADDLESCEITLQAAGRLNQLNNEDSLLKILKRCPVYVRSRWQSRVQELRAQGMDPSVKDIRKLIRLAANQHGESKRQNQFSGLTSNNGGCSSGQGLPIVPLKVKCRGMNKIVTTYALLDSGSTASFCSDDLLKELGIEGKTCQIQLATIDGVHDECQTAMVTLEVANFEEDICIQIDNVFSTKSLNIPRTAIAKQKDVDLWPHLNGVIMPEVIADANVNLLIGVDTPEALEPSAIRNSEGGGPFAVKTKFGWTLNGPFGRDNATEQRLGYLKRRLTRDPALRVRYTNFIDDLLVKGHARKIPDAKKGCRQDITWYLPHHNVVNPKKPEKTRVVFDCAAKFHGVSLNSNILQGPNLTNSLVGVLCRFRQERIALVADVESMYHQVCVDPKDTEALRFLWFPGGDLSKEPEEYQMVVHLFGGIWSACCANFALKRTALDNTSKFDPMVTRTVDKNFYVDGMLKSVRSTDEAIWMQRQLTELLSCGGFHLTKWSSSCRKVLDSIPQNERSKDLKHLNIQYDALPVERTLGLEWNIESDTFRFKINSKERPATRRGILSIISSIFDPLGFVAPFVLPAKRLLQASCKDLEWDKEISGENLINWNQWLVQMPMLENFQMRRCIKVPEFGTCITQEIHHFSDASETGYGTVSYLRTVHQNGKIKTAFLFAKSRLAPLKRITIPRLELTAAALAVKIDTMLKNELEICIHKSMFWTDSTSVLRYINNKDKRFHTFVANRITVIHEGSDPEQWRYVPTKSNPADDASRGMTANELLRSERWISGPEFLLQTKDKWPKCNVSIAGIPEDDVEVKRLAQSNSVNVKDLPFDKLMWQVF
eukprot:gene8763-biopygen9751